MAVQSVIPDPSCDGMKGGAVCARRLVIIRANAYSFQAVMKQNTAVAAIPVAACDSTILKNASTRVYPSTRAASSYSLGISSMKPFISHTENDGLKAVYSMISPMCESTSPTARYIRNIGIATTTGGSILVLRMKNSQSCSPGMRKREKPYAVIVPIATARNVLTTAMIRLFKKRLMYADG